MQGHGNSVTSTCRYQNLADVVDASVQTASDSGEPMSTQSSTDTGDLDLDAIIAAGGSFDDQSAANASGGCL